MKVLSLHTKPALSSKRRSPGKLVSGSAYSQAWAMAGCGVGRNHTHQRGSREAPPATVAAFFLRLSHFHNTSTADLRAIVFILRVWVCLTDLGLSPLRFFRMTHLLKNSQDNEDNVHMKRR